MSQQAVSASFVSLCGCHQLFMWFIWLATVFSLLSKCPRRIVPPSTDVCWEWDYRRGVSVSQPRCVRSTMRPAFGSSLCLSHCKGEHTLTAQWHAQGHFFPVVTWSFWHSCIFAWKGWNDTSSVPAQNANKCWTLLWKLLQNRASSQVNPEENPQRTRKYQCWCCCGNPNKNLTSAVSSVVWAWISVTWGGEADPEHDC